jgi:phage tail-like protein
MANRVDTPSLTPAVTNFRVTWGVMAPSVFQEANGLEEDISTVLQRRADAGASEPIKVVAGQLTLRRGLVAVEDRLWNWYRSAAADAVIRSFMLIDLIDDAGVPLITWLVKNAWPTNVIAAANPANGAFSVESIDFAFESIEVTSG